MKPATMRHPFVVGASYTKDYVADYLGGGNRQSGVLYGPGQPGLVAIFTGGKHSTVPGYPDQWTNDGAFLYCGQGSKGDQKMSGANAVIADRSRTVLVYEAWQEKGKTRTNYRFKGDFVVTGYEMKHGEGPRAMDQLIIFSLAPTAIGANVTESLPAAPIPENAQALRESAIRASRDFQLQGSTKRNYRQRSAAVHAYALARARGACERCDRPAPFIGLDGTPFLEVHHTQRLADDGPDDIFHVAAICPNCHREAHYGQDPAAAREGLETKIRKKEPEHTNGI